VEVGALSFTQEVKRELAACAGSGAGELDAEAQGMLLPCIDIPARRIRLVTESADAAKRMALLCEHLGAFAEVGVQGSGAYLAQVEGQPAAMARILERMGLSPTALALRIGRATLEEARSVHAFLRGFFLSGGTVTEPERGYRLEFVTSHRQLCTDLEALLQEQQFTPIRTLRRGRHLLCFKSADAVSALLLLMGAPQAAERVRRARRTRAIHNAVNRQVNSSMANLNKTAVASAAQSEAIAALMRRGALQALPEPLQRTAALRLDNPEATLAELSALSGEFSRSTLARNLNKLVALAEDLSGDA